MRLTKDQLYKPYGLTDSGTSSAATAAANVAITDSGSLIDATDVEGALQEIAGDVAAIPSATTAVANHSDMDGGGGLVPNATNKAHHAAAITFGDTGDLYAASDTEAALTEAMTVHNAHKNADGAGGTNAPATNMVHNAGAIEIADAGTLFDATTVEAALAEEAGKRILIKHFFSSAIDEFPIHQCWFRNHSCDNTKSTSNSTPITIASVDTTNGTFGGVAYNGFITLSFVPYRPSLFAPTAGEEWAVIDCEYHDGGAEPGRSGNYTLRLKIIGGVYADKKLYYVADYGSEGDLTVGDVVCIYNPHESATGWTWLNSGNYMIGGTGGTSWRSKYVDVLGLFKHSDGTYRMLVDGKSNTNEFSIGAFSSSDLVTWTPLNSDQPYFSKQTGIAWCYAGLFGGSGCYYLDYENRYILPATGFNSSGRKTLGWVKFTEDFTELEYAAAESVVRDSGYDHWFPAIVKYGGRWMITYGVDETPGVGDSVLTWYTRMAFANRPDGVYTDEEDFFGSTELTAIKSNDGVFCSSHFTDIMPFNWRGRLYALGFGCSKYNDSGNRGKLEIGLFYWNERKAVPGWEIDPRNPVFFNALYASATMWGANFQWQADHIGARMVFYAENQYLYFFHGGCNGTDTYKICGRKLLLT